MRGRPHDCWRRCWAMSDRTPTARWIKRHFGYPLEAVAAAVVYGAFALLPAGAASAAGGWLGRTIGPLLPAHRRATRSLARAMPELSPADARRVIRGMWDNLGRVMGEYPHIDSITRDPGRGRVDVTGMEHLATLRDKPDAAILFSGHLANWEVIGHSLKKLGLPYAQVYRAPNNPFIERMMHRVRRMDADDVVPKGAAGARKAIEVLRAGRQLGVLVDQKMNDGIAVPFFGQTAMTAPAMAQLGIRFGCPVVPVRLERLAGCRFRLSFHAPLALTDSGDRQADVLAAMTRVNVLLEGWIRDRPDQWLWVHRRWPED